ncbi:PilZ domain-containing protein [Sessilibacter sp. MAH2]
MSEDRRRYFRIDDQIGVSYKIISENDLSGELKPLRVADNFGALRKLNKEIATTLQEVKLKDPLVGNVLEALDKKINVVINQLEMDNLLVQRIAHHVHEVNISACGMGFYIDEALAEATLLSLDLILIPDNINIGSFGRVISCESVEDKKYYVRLEFFGMSSVDQELLIQHIVRRQGYLIRSNLNS